MFTDAQLISELKEELKSQQGELISMEKDVGMPSREFHLNKKKQRITQLQQRIRDLSSERN